MENARLEVELRAVPAATVAAVALPAAWFVREPAAAPVSAPAVAPAPANAQYRLRRGQDAVVQLLDFRGAAELQAHLVPWLHLVNA